MMNIRRVLANLYPKIGRGREEEGRVSAIATVQDGRVDHVQFDYFANEHECLAILCFVSLC